MARLLTLLDANGLQPLKLVEEIVRATAGPGSAR